MQNIWYVKFKFLLSSWFPTVLLRVNEFFISDTWSAKFIYCFVEFLSSSLHQMYASVHVLKHMNHPCYIVSHENCESGLYITHFERKNMGSSSIIFVGHEMSPFFSMLGLLVY